MAARPNLDTIRKLLDSGDKETARQQIAKLLYRDSMNTHAWWLYAQVTEDKKLRYSILNAMVELPPDAYTAKARAMLSNLPYQEVPQNDPLLALVHSHANTKRPTQNNTMIIAAAFAVVLGIGMILGIVLFLNNSKPLSEASASIATNTPNKFGIVLVTRTPRPATLVVSTTAPTQTETIEPTNTYTATPSDTPTPDQADVLTPLQTKLNKNASDLVALSNDTLNIVNDPTHITPSTVDTVTKNVQQIQKLRSELMMMDLTDVSPDTRLNVVYPVTLAFTNYANTVVTLVDLKLNANRPAAPTRITLNGDASTATSVATGAATSAATTTGTATPMTGTTAPTMTSTPNTGGVAAVGGAPAASAVGAQSQSGDTDPTAQIGALSSGLLVYQDNLTRALSNYQLYTMQTIATDQLSNQAIVVSSNNPTALNLKGGTYTVTYELDTALSSGGSIMLVPADGSTGKAIQIANTSTQDKYGNPGGTQTVQISAGSYQVQINSVKVWVIALDQQ